MLFASFSKISLQYFFGETHYLKQSFFFYILSNIKLVYDYFLIFYQNQARFTYTFACILPLLVYTLHNSTSHFSDIKSHSSNLPFKWIQSTHFTRPHAITFNLINVTSSFALLLILCLSLWLYSFVNQVFISRFDCIIIIYR